MSAGDDRELSSYEVEFIPAERRLNDRRSGNPTTRYTGPERRAADRRGERRSDDRPFSARPS